MVHRQIVLRSSRTRAFLCHLGVLAAVSLLSLVDAKAQEPGCTLQPTGVPPLQVIRCRDGLTIEATAGAGYTLLDHTRDGIPDSVNLRSGAVLVDAPGQASRRGFQITTPQAIAAVRGTQWAVDVTSGKTAVFVLTGRVLVRRPTGRRGVTLGPGDGVDVEPGTAPLQVKRWSAERAAALLARFGR
jgi:ferric-dicitrate binding protein FerR (iron transport regulator)